MSGYSKLWLDYKRVEDKGFSSFARGIILKGFDKTPIIDNAVKELIRGFRELLCIDIKLSTSEKKTGEDEVKTGHIILTKKEELTGREGYRITIAGKDLLIIAEDENGILYGVFELLRRIALGFEPENSCGDECPSNPFRMLDHWDNMTGDIERGYSGNSFFFENGRIIINDRTREYARLLASVGINASCINNVNVRGDASYLITDRYLDKVKELSDIFASYGIKLFLSLNFASPIELGGLDSCDPLDEGVIKWWEDKIREIYKKIPDFGGFLVKADSEGRPGPFTYGRTQAEGANMLARAIKPYGGIIIWRCFVYNCTQDWRDTKTDRARASYDNFINTDGDYEENVILQIKNGPMDFQIREPVSPLLGGLKKTNQMLEVQIAQEYTGQQIDVCYLIPMFKEVLEFSTGNGEERDHIKEIVAGRTFGRKYGGITAVANTGNDANWTGNDLAAANLYGFGRLAFDTELSAEEIAREWTVMTYGRDREVIETIVNILMNSREVYEKYTSPLGIGWMVTPATHYGPSVDGYEYDRWGTYHRADNNAIGVDRTDKGTGFTGQYYKKNEDIYNDLGRCPEELILFFHRLRYNYRLRSGKTLLQHIYDTHFEGYEDVCRMIEHFNRIKDRLPCDAVERISERFDRQLNNAREWRDQVNSYFYRKTGIPDEKGRKIY